MKHILSLLLFVCFCLMIASYSQKFPLVKGLFEVACHLAKKKNCRWTLFDVFKARKNAVCETGNHSFWLVQWMSCVVVILRERESLLSVVGSSSGISSSQESIICGETAACLCPMSTDKQQADYNHLSHTGLLRSQSAMLSLRRQTDLPISVHQEC